MESIGQAVFEMFENNTPEPVKTLLTNIPEAYVLVTWPESQNLMEEPWFREECYLCQSNGEQEHFDSAYFVPIKRIL